MKNESLDNIATIKVTIPPVKRDVYRHYGFHPWFTSRPYNVLQKYITNYSLEGELVLDPFMGSGVTNTEALVQRRKTFGLDISSLAVFITKMKCVSPVNIEKMDKEFLRIKERVGPHINKIEISSYKNLKKTKVPHWYPRNIPLPKNADRKFVHELFTKKQLICLSILLHEIKKIRNPDIKDIFKLIFSGTLVKTNILYDLPQDGRTIYGGQCSVFSRGRYWVPKKTIEVPIFEAFEKRYLRVRKAKVETNQFIGNYFNNETCQLLKGDATEIPLEDNSVDYCFTDPPYGAHITYLDLSTMWNAWLGFKITQEDRKKEVIEGGSLDKDAENYKLLLKKSLKEIYRVLKPNRWLSIIFHHKKIALWNYVVEGCQEAGLSYINSVAQPPFLPSTHKIKNPLKVLAAELILNFRKTTPTKAFTQFQVPAKNLILNSAEKTIVRHDGATIDQIYQELVPELVEAGMLDEAQKHFSDINPLLKDTFQLGNDMRWRLRDDIKLGAYIPLKDRLKFYITSYLRREKQASLDEITTNLLPNLINGKTPTDKEVLDILNIIAVPTKENLYRIREKPLPEQGEFDFEQMQIGDRKGYYSRKFDDNHTEMMYLLAEIGQAKFNFDIWIGKREQHIFFSNKKLEVNYLKEFPIRNLTDMQERKVRQIDVIWFYKTSPIFAFEVEETSSIISALDRFKYILELNNNLAKRLVVVAPERRNKKLQRELRESTYVGHPLYMENKVRYLYYQEIRKFYNDIIEALQKFSLSSLDGILHSPLENKL